MPSASGLGKAMPADKGMQAKGLRRGTIFRIASLLLCLDPTCNGSGPHGHSSLFTLHSSLKWHRKPFFILLSSLFSLLFLASCSISRHIPDEAYYLKHVSVESTNPKVTDDYLLGDYVLQRPNKKWFIAKVPLRLYCLSKPDTDGQSHYSLWRKIGEAPVLYDSLRTARTLQSMRQVLASHGYLHANVWTEEKCKGKKLSLTYHIDPREQFVVQSLTRQVDDPNLALLIEGPDTLASLLAVGMPFDTNILDAERTRITSKLRQIGYYKFNKEYITFTADTLAYPTAPGVRPPVGLTLHLSLQQEDSRSLPQPHQQMRIGDINYHVDQEGVFRPSLLTTNTAFHTGELFNEQRQTATYSNLMRLQAIAHSHIRFTQRENTDTLDCDLFITHAKPRSFAVEVEGTNSAGDLGAALSLSFQNKNLFHGSELLSIKLRGAYEAISGLSGYDGNSYTEIGVETGLKFPGFLLPFVKKSYGATHQASSEISLQFNTQNRPEFDRRVLTAAWRYHWKSRSQRVQHRFDLLEINYIYMPWISTTFKEQYLDSIGKQNAILYYNYEDLLITKLGYTFSYNSLGTAANTTYGRNATTFRFSVETSGNVLNALTSAFGAKYNDEGERTFCGIAYAQYAKASFDFSRSIRLDENNSLAIHAAFGIAVPYGNSDQLPFEKRYFAGGANSVRGWSVRSLGPGAYSGADQQINFLNQSGDIKIDANIEYRAFLFWKISGALFVDAGNIWTIKKYEDQPDGEFRFDKFYQQIAVSYGLGLRFNLDFFILRLDAGMKAINPAYHGRDHYPIIHPNLDRDFAFHFAVGLPF